MEGDMKKLQVPVPVAKSRSGSCDTSVPVRVTFVEKSVSMDEMDAITTVSSSTTRTSRTRRSASETLSDDRSSEISADSSGVYEVIEYDPSHQVRSPFSTNLDVTYEDVDGEEFIGTGLDIGENTPAAEALRASAAVRVSRVGKAARAVNMQAVRKLVKRATGTTKHGVVKGKPPRLPPHSPMQFDDIEEEDEEESEEDEQFNDSQVHEHSRHPTPQTIKDHMPDDVVAGTAEAGTTVLGSVDPHNILKVLRWRKKKKGYNDKKPKSYVKGKVIDGEHELYTLSIAVMIGVRTSISKTNNILNSGPSKRWVLPQDHRAAEKYEFRPKGGTGLPAHQLAHTFKFKDYAPVVFAYLRRLSGINEFDFLISVCGNANFIEFVSNAKSGQFFFYSSDGRFMIKTMTNAESKFLRRILPDYFRHCCENPNTMITKFFGMYRVKLYHLRRNVKFVIMNSVYYTDKYLQTFYDLKGSIVGRDAKPGQAVKKDNDLRRVLPDEALALRAETRATVRKQLEKDLHFLQQTGIMDYSMLVGIHHVPPATDKSIATTGYRTSTRKSSRRLLTNVDTPGTDSTDIGREQTATPAHAGDPSPAVQNDGATPSRRQLHNEDFRSLLYEDDLDDDDSSYLKGSEKRPKESKRLHEDTEQKKLVTIEKLYWPFHHLFDIHGHRRMALSKCVTCGELPCKCIPDESLHGYKRKFQPPLSDRKDGGLEMDTTGLTLPLIYKGNNGDQLYEGKIFYMGIIDILQEYNSRKMFEAQYRLFQASGKAEASCVDPKTYGQRFLEFFDEYTTRSNEGVEGVEMTLALHESTSGALDGSSLEDDSPRTPDTKQILVHLASPEGMPPTENDVVVDGEKPGVVDFAGVTVSAGHPSEYSQTISVSVKEGDDKTMPGVVSDVTKTLPKASPLDLRIIDPSKKSPARKTGIMRSTAAPSNQAESALGIVSPMKENVETKPQERSIDVLQAKGNVESKSPDKSINVTPLKKNFELKSSDGICPEKSGSRSVSPRRLFNGRGGLKD